MLNDQLVFYDIEYATAHHEAVMTRAKAIILALLQGPTPMDRDLAAATATLLESEIATMKKTIVQVEKAVHAHYKRPEDRKVNTANAQRSMELLGLLERFEQHIDTHFPDTSHNDRSIRIYLALLPPCNLIAVQYLNSEVITRDPQDPTHQGYRDAMPEVADYVPTARQAINRLASDAPSPEQIQYAKTATEVLDSIDQIVGPYRK